MLRRWGFSWGGWLDNRHGEWWLIAQLVLIAAHALPAWPAPASLGLVWPWPLQLLGWALFALGLALAAQAFWRLGSSLSPLPDPLPGAALVISGAYARCRHPMYQAVLLCSLGVTVALGSLLHLGLLLGLVRRAGRQGPPGGASAPVRASGLRRLPRLDRSDRAASALAGLALIPASALRGWGRRGGWPGSRTDRRARPSDRGWWPSWGPAPSPAPVP